MNSIFVIAFAALFAAVAVAFSIEATDEQKDLIKQYVEQCTKEVNLTEEEIAKIKAKDFKNPSENLKCFGNCFYEKTGTFKDGVIQEEVVLKKLGPIIGEDKTRKALAKCGSIKGENNCDTATQLYECFQSFKTAEIKA